MKYKQLNNDKLCTFVKNTSFNLFDNKLAYPLYYQTDQKTYWHFKSKLNLKLHAICHNKILINLKINEI